VAIVLIWRVAEVMAELELWSEATDGAPSHLTRRAKAVGGVSAPRSVSKRLPTVSPVVEDDGMQIDATIVSGCQGQAGGQTGLDARIVGKPELSQCSLRTRQITLLDNEVEILVPTSLMTDQCIDPPAAVDPHRDPFAVEAIEDCHHVARLHRIRAARLGRQRAGRDGI
jgi:hypothetical protein